MSEAEQIDQLLEASLRVEFLQGKASGVAFAYSTGWRTLPVVVVSQWMQSDFYYEREGHPPLLVHDGEAVLTPTGLHHRASALRDYVYCRWAHLRFTLFGSVDLLSLLDLPPVLIPPFSDRAGDFCEALSLLADSTDAHTLSGIIRKQSLCLQFLEFIMEQAPIKSAGISLLTRISRVAPVLRYLEQHLADDVTRDELAALVSLSPTQFHAVFKGAMGLSPMEYLKRQRIHRAQELLMQTDLPVASVATRVGFSDPFHFSRQFHAACGSSPRQYRQHLRTSLLTDFRGELATDLPTPVPPGISQ